MLAIKCDNIKVDQHLHLMALDAIQKAYGKLLAIYGTKDVRTVTVSYDIKSGATLAGQAVYSEWLIRLNPKFFAHYAEKFLNTVVHEYVHLYARAHFKRCVGHGAEWKKMMVDVGADPSRCHRYDCSVVKNSTKTSEYFPKKAWPIYCTYRSYHADFITQEIAAQLGINITTARTYLHACKRRDRARYI